jgi:hypothetical protein
MATPSIPTARSPFNTGTATGSAGIQIGGDGYTIRQHLGHQPLQDLPELRAPQLRCDA